MKKIEKEKKVKVKKQKVKSSGKGLIGIILTLVLTIGIYGALVYVNNNVITDIFYTEAVTAKADIPMNTLITAENLNTYFDLSARDQATLPANYITDPTKYIGQYVSNNVFAKEVITSEDFTDKNLVKYKKPVELSLTVSDMGDNLAGKLRSGDMINLCVTKANNSNGENKIESSYLFENILVKDVFDSNGCSIALTDTESNAYYITFILEKEDCSTLDSAIVTATNVRVSRNIK